MATPHVLSLRRRSVATVVASAARAPASIEFVLLFPALFLIFYAVVTYDLIFGAQQALTLYDYGAAPLVPPLPGPFLLPVPDSLNSESVVRISRTQLL